MGIELDHRVRGMIASSSVNMVRDRRGSYIVMTIAVSGVATLENKETHWSLSSISMKVGTRCRSSSSSGSRKDAVHPSRGSPNTSWRFTLGASNVCLVGENPTCSVPAQ